MINPAPEDLVQPLGEALFQSLVAVRRDLHQHPELSWEEERTAGKVGDYLTDLGIAFEACVAGHGIIATLPGTDDSRGAIALRADLDALPVQEETGLPFSSQNDGVMHACGHDGHTTMLLGAASLLAAEPELPVPVKLVFQPAEETGKGAPAVLESGALDDVAMIFGGHIDRHYPLGTIVVSDGPVNASSDTFTISISGKGGHGGRPHETVDAVVVGSLLVTALQTIVSREVNPAHPSVISVGSFQAGSAPNVIADRAVLSGTIRAQDPEVRVYLHESIRRIAAAVAQLHGARVDAEIAIDDYVYTPDDEIEDGEVETGKRYEEDDFNKKIEILERERKRVEIFMEMIDQREKTIVFCATQLHALLVRDLINQMKQSTDPNYCARVTANDGSIGELHLKHFQDNEKTIPTILTTSQKLSTGVDARNVRNIVLMRPVKSMIEFKQIVGRGTRLFDGKDYFTIYDFVRAYLHFSDPEWDGEPLEPEPAPPAPEPSGEPADPTEPPPGDPEPPRRIVKVTLADGKARQIQHMVSTSFWSPDGTPMSSAQFLEQLFGDLPSFFTDEGQLREIWSHPDTRRKLLDGLAEKGYSEGQLSEISKLINAEKSDLFDVLGYIAFALAPETREERVDGHKDLIFSHYDDKQQAFLDFVLSQYINEGVGELQPEKLPSLLELKYHGIHDATEELGEVSRIRELFVGFQRHLFEVREQA